MNKILQELSINNENYGSCIGGDDWSSTTSEGIIKSINPSNGETIASVYKCSESDYETILKESDKAFLEWKKVPAPIRGQLIFEMGNELRKNNDNTVGPTKSILEYYSLQPNTIACFYYH